MVKFTQTLRPLLPDFYMGSKSMKFDLDSPLEALWFRNGAIETKACTRSADNFFYLSPNPCNFTGSGAKNAKFGLNF